MMQLPESFLQEMRDLLGEEYGVWLSSYGQSPAQGLRIHSGKLAPGQWERMTPFPAEPVPWTTNGYYLPEGERLSRHPWYYAGLYYIQEPSAMAPAALLPVKPGDRVLDLCAAPGGKSTELGVRLHGEGLLVSNDLSHSRAKALLRNMERFGICNLCVTSETPEKLADTFGAWFDAILVDAPCSGEGMFRRDPALIRSWEERGPSYYAPIQQSILEQAVRMLRPGGYLLYSTCTFSKTEDEDVVHALLRRMPEMELLPLPLFDGARGGVDGEPVIRLFPHRVRGEGHFAALFCKQGAVGRQEPLPSSDVEATTDRWTIGRLERETDFLVWESMLDQPFDRRRLMMRDDMLFLLPDGFDRAWKLRYLRSGLFVGSRKGARFEPSQAVAMTLRPKGFAQTISFSAKDERVIRYLKGETVFPDDDVRLGRGWVLVCVDDFPLGWAKYTGNALKNKYDAGWRMS